MVRKATCCCGASSIEVDGEPRINAICHCRNCKARTGSAFGWSAYFADSQIQAKTGDFRVYEINRPDTQQQRWFCARCGTTLYWQVSRWPGHTGVAGGCFVETPLETPSLTANNDGRCAWLGLPEDWRVVH